MILVDSTIVSVATPAIISDLHADVNDVVWVTSAYLLAYAVPVLITGRLGDRFGPKKLYMSGLTVFTLASLWCGLTSTVEMLIVARVVQGLGASMITPQTMAIITRIFPAARRGKAMALWGATAGVATLVGPILGGVLVDAARLGVDLLHQRPGRDLRPVPRGPAGADAARPTPTRSTGSGVALSGAGMFLLVFGIQEGHQYDWSTAIWAMIVVGIVVLVLFVLWQARNRQEPLVPLGLFRDRNFSLANVSISVMGFAITALAIPLMLWAQVVRGLSPTRSALLLVPMAIMTIVLARPVGNLTDRVHPRMITGFGFAATIVSLLWLSHEMTPGRRRSRRSSARWCCSASATRSSGRPTPPPRPATCRCSRPAPAPGSTTPPGRWAPCSARRPSRCSSTPGWRPRGCPAFEGTGSTGGRLPAAFTEGFSQAMATSMLLPAAVLVLGLVASLLFERPRHEGYGAPAGR